MPVSKNGKPYYTDEQYQTARYDSSALEYARAQGYDLVQKGKYHTLREHDSMVFTDKGGWFWNSRNIHGGAIEFITQYEHKPLVEAVLILSGENVHTQEALTRYERKPDTLTVAEAKPFVPPERNDNYNRAFAYLVKTRGIDPDIVSQLMKEKKIYESKEHHNVVFNFQDNDGNIKGAFLRGTSTHENYQFKGMATGSDRASSYFSFGGAKTASVACVFEAAIDAMSYATLQKWAGNADLTQRYYVATGGAGDSNFMSFLAGHTEVKSVILCQDNDQSGNKFAKDLGDKLRAMGYQVMRTLSSGKDFNEDLLKEKNLDKAYTPKENRFVIVPDDKTNSNIMSYFIRDTATGKCLNNMHGSILRHTDEAVAIKEAEKLNNSSGYVECQRFEGLFPFSDSPQYRSIFSFDSKIIFYGEWRTDEKDAIKDLESLQNPIENEEIKNEPQPPHNGTVQKEDFSTQLTEKEKKYLLDLKKCFSQLHSVEQMQERYEWFSLASSVKKDDLVKEFMYSPEFTGSSLSEEYVPELGD